MQPRIRTGVASAAVVVLCVGSVGALLGQLYDVASMRTLLLAVTLPTSVALAAIVLLPVPGWAEDIRGRIRVGALGGVLGVVGYDVFRIPFALAGMRVFAPISSYGLLGMGADQATGATTVLGWVYHLSNGVAFGIAFAVLFARRSRWLAVAYGVAIEAAAFLGPFTAEYGLTGKWAAIGVAFAAHVAYGYPLGVVVERYDAVRGALDRSKAPVALSLAASVVAILLVFRPWSVDDAQRLAYDIADQSGVPTAVIAGDDWRPEWLRIDANGCFDVVNPTSRDFDSDLGPVPAGETSRFCIPDAGVQRVRLDERPFSGGFVYVED